MNGRQRSESFTPIIMEYVNNFSNSLDYIHFTSVDPDRVSLTIDNQR